MSRVGRAHGKLARARSSFLAGCDLERVVRAKREECGGSWGRWIDRSADALAHPRKPPHLARFLYNGTYSVQVYREPAFAGVERLTVRRHDTEPVHSWTDLQRIKNEITGPERVAVELYPRAGDVIDAANLYHLWVYPPGATVPFGLHLDGDTGAEVPS